jgi:hypothetical protein
VARRYAWGKAHGRVHAPDRLLVLNRVRELRHFLSYRYGQTLPDDDAGRDDLEILLSFVMQLNPGRGVVAMIREARAWAPWLSSSEASDFAERIAARRPIKLKADTIAQRLGCTYAERTLLKLTTIGCCDLTRRQRDEAVRKARNTSEGQRRRRKGVMPRDEYEAKARALRAEARASGISYDAMRKRLQRAAKAPVSQVRRNRISDIQRWPQTWDKEVKGPVRSQSQHLPLLLLML